MMHAARCLLNGAWCKLYVSWCMMHDAFWIKYNIIRYIELWSKYLLSCLTKCYMNGINNKYMWRTIYNCAHTVYVSIYIYKVIIFVCLFVCMSDHNSWTARPNRQICVTYYRSYFIYYVYWDTLWYLYID